GEALYGLARLTHTGQLIFRQPVLATAALAPHHARLDQLTAQPGGVLVVLREDLVDFFLRVAPPRLKGLHDVPQNSHQLLVLCGEGLQPSVTVGKVLDHLPVVGGKVHVVDLCPQRLLGQQPLRHLVELLNVEAVDVVVALRTCRYEARVCQAAQVMGHGRRAHVQYGGHFLDRHFVLGQQPDDLQPVCICQRLEELQQFVCFLYYHFNSASINLIRQT